MIDEATCSNCASMELSFARACLDRDIAERRLAEQVAFLAVTLTEDAERMARLLARCHELEAEIAYIRANLAPKSELYP